MSKPYVEIDFFQLEKRSIDASSQPSSPQRNTSFKGIQNVVSRINPQLLRTVMAAGQARPSERNPAWSTLSSLPSPSPATSPSPLPAFNAAASRRPSPPEDTAPLTIFYDGAVATFDVPRLKAEAIMRMAETGTQGSSVEGPEGSLLLDNQLEEDLPIMRKKSLQRFLERRKERLVSASPYHRLGPSCPC